MLRNGAIRMYFNFISVELRVGIGGFAKMLSDGF